MSEMDLKVPVGSLVTIVGQTGSGKSSLLAAGLGLMNQITGPAPEVHGKVSLIPETSGTMGLHAIIASGQHQQCCAVS